MNALAPTHRYKLRVYFEDTDAGGVVYYANYLKFAERARTEMLRAAGIEHARMVAEEGLMLVVRHCAADFRRSARLDDELEVETRLSEIAGASLSLAQTIRRDGETLVELSVTVACISREGRPRRIPKHLRAAIAIN
ncbi:MAG TPA: tol-pal system-associated acyl-CoA thioesterase [Candidatus Cybelea sp.]|nr:tol-pal system-associated acyl-CoA thioesterase [Candidatus Cybelea sp.]